MTSVTAWMLCSIMAEAGLPAGVVNMVFGYGATAGEAIVTHPKVITSLPYFGVKLSCVCLLFAYRKK